MASIASTPAAAQVAIITVAEVADEVTAEDAAATVGVDDGRARLCEFFRSLFRRAENAV